MNIVLMLSGGRGTRLSSNVPKQYIEVNGKPIIEYSVEKFQNNKHIDKIIIVCSKEWKTYLSNLFDGRYDKVDGYAPGGETRQESILNGLLFCEERYNASNVDVVLIHDAARPNVSNEMINSCILGVSNGFDGVMPAIPVKDTIYYVDDERVEKLLDRDKLYAGQSPESFVFSKYLAINKKTPSDILNAIKGSTEIAFMNNLNIRVIKGDEKNYKITTINDLNKFIEEEKNESI